MDMEGGVFDDSKKNEISNNLIDPELGALSSEPVLEDQQQTQSIEKETWERNLGLLSSLRDYVKELLKEEDEKERQGQGEDLVMTDHDHDGGVNGMNMEAMQQDGAENDERAKEEQSDAQALYPVLRAVAVA